MSVLEIVKATRDYKELQIMIKEMQDEAEAIKGMITAHMDSEGLTELQADIFTVKLTPYTTSRVDTTALKNELPEIAERYTKTTETRRFQVA